MLSLLFGFFVLFLFNWTIFSNFRRIYKCMFLQSAPKSLDLVVQANPEQPPWGIASMIRSLTSDKSLAYYGTSHSHSTVKGGLPQNLLDFLPESTCQDRTKAHLKVTIIWKGGKVKVLFVFQNQLMLEFGNHSQIALSPPQLPDCLPSRERRMLEDF